MSTVHTVRWRPTYIEYSWELSESITVALDEVDGQYLTAVYHNEKCQELSVENHGASRAAADQRIVGLIAGSWRDFFDDDAELLADLEREVAEAGRFPVAG